MQFPKPTFERRVPKKSDRGKFDKKTTAMIIERDQGICQNCLNTGSEIHHVMYKSRSGRGVFTNGLTLCQHCHRKVHESAVLTDYWINVFADRYGSDFYKDIHDV